MSSCFSSLQLPFALINVPKNTNTAGRQRDGLRGYMRSHLILAFPTLLLFLLYLVLLLFLVCFRHSFRYINILSHSFSSSSSLVLPPPFPFLVFSVPSPPPFLSSSLHPFFYPSVHSSIHLSSFRLYFLPPSSLFP